MRSRFVPGLDQGMNEQRRWGRIIACLCLVFLVGLPAVGCAVTRDQVIQWEKEDRAVEPLIAALKDEDRDVRGAAAGVLGKIGDARAVESLNALIERVSCSKAEDIYKLVANKFLKGAIKERRCPPPSSGGGGYYYYYVPCSTPVTNPCY